jgi:hypothetical protein
MAGFRPAQSGQAKNMRNRILVTILALCALAAAPSAASAWAPAGSAAVHPGVQTYTDGAQCTANFVLTRGTDTFIGQAAHCSGTGAATETNGCDSASLPVGTPVEIDGASRPGTLVYNSWITMQQAGETDPNTCQYNDFALVKIDPADVPNTNPSIPFWGGPTGTGTAAVTEDVFSYGNSSLRFGVTTLSPKQGKVTGVDGGGWSYNVYTATPGIPGDSGSAFLNDSGQALGVLSTLEGAPRPTSNNVGDFGREVAYAQAHGFDGLALANGTEPFNPSLTK